MPLKHCRLKEDIQRADNLKDFRHYSAMLVQEAASNSRRNALCSLPAPVLQTLMGKFEPGQVLVMPNCRDLKIRNSVCKRLSFNEGQYKQRTI